MKIHHLKYKGKDITAIVINEDNHKVYILDTAKLSNDDIHIIKAGGNVNDLKTFNAAFKSLIKSNTITVNSWEICQRA